MKLFEVPTQVQCIKLEHRLGALVTI